MMIEEALHFSQNFKYADLDFSNHEQLINAFEDRVQSFYFEPARHLKDDSFSFARGVLIFTAIDFIQHYLTGAKISTRIKEFCSNLKSIKNLPKKDVNERTKLLYDEFRNGLIHSGEIKRLSQFSLDGNELMVVQENFAIVNPSILLEETIDLFEVKINNVKRSATLMAKTCERLRLSFTPQPKRTK